MDLIKTVFLIAVATSSLSADAVSQPNIQDVLNSISSLNSRQTQGRSLPTARMDPPAGDAMPLRQPSQVAIQGPSETDHQSPEYPRPYEFRRALKQHIPRLHRLLLDALFAMTANRDLTLKRSWPKSSVHTRFAPFGTKLVPNRNSLGNGGSTLFRYGRSM